MAEMAGSNHSLRLFMSFSFQIRLCGVDTILPLQNLPNCQDIRITIIQAFHIEKFTLNVQSFHSLENNNTMGVNGSIKNGYKPKCVAFLIRKRRQNTD